MTRRSMMGLVRDGQREGPMTGFLITWDVDSSDRRTVDRVRRFVLGYQVRVNGTVYRYPGFVARAGVRYLGQSSLFVQSSLRDEIDGFLQRLGVDHETIPASLG